MIRIALCIVVATVFAGLLLGQAVAEYVNMLAPLLAR